MFPELCERLKQLYPTQEGGRGNFPSITGQSEGQVKTQTCGWFWSWGWRGGGGLAGRSPKL